MIDAWNQLGLDYSVFGNHEFDYGDAVLLERMKESNFKWLGANVYLDCGNDGSFQNPPSAWLPNARGVGATRSDVADMASPRRDQLSR